jgi:hypothetical protein
MDLQDDPAFGEVTEDEVAEVEAEAAKADKDRGKE